METICLRVGEMACNCYLATDLGTGKTMIIDPGEEADFITTTILENKLTPTGIVLTHGHYDHCLAVLELKLNFSVPIYLHPKDLFLYEKSHLSAKRFSGIGIPKLPSVDHLLEDGQEIQFGSSSLRVLHTPGHTPGSVCFFSDLDLFTGDTLFSDSLGRTDLSYSSSTELTQSLSKLSKLPANTAIRPGHGDPSTLGHSLAELNL